MGNAYTTAQKVIDATFDDLSAEVQALLSGWIEDESREIDAWLPNYATPFNAITDSPATPSMVEKACRYLVAHRVMLKLKLIRYDENGKPEESFETKAEALLHKLASGEMVIPASQLA